MQEMKANAWTKDVVLRYLNLCSDLKVVHAGPLSSSGLTVSEQVAERVSHTIQSLSLAGCSHFGANDATTASAVD